MPLRRPRPVVFPLAVLLLVGCDAPGVVESDHTPPPSVPLLATPQGDGDGDWGEGPQTQEEWDAEAEAFKIEFAEINLIYSFPSSGSPGFQMTTAMNNPLGPLISTTHIRHDWVASVIADGSPGTLWHPDTYAYHPTGARSDFHEITNLDCSLIQESATFNVMASHFGQWQHVTRSFATEKGPEVSSGEGACDLQEADPGDPPPGNGGGGGDGGDGENCSDWVLTIYEWDGFGWDIIDEIPLTFCD